MDTYSTRALTILLFFISFSPLTFANHWQKPNEIPDAYGHQVELIQNANGELMAFYIEPDKEVVYRTQSNQSDNKWGKRKSLNIYANQIKLAKHKDGRIEVFAIGLMASVVTHVTQMSPNSDEWSKEKTAKGIYASQIELANNLDGSLVMVFIKPDKEISYIKQLEPNSNEWSKKKDLNSYANQIAVSNHKDGRLEIAIIGTMANVTSHQTQLKPNSDEWSKEKDIKGVYAKQVEFVKSKDGDLKLFYIKPDSEIAYLNQSNEDKNKWSKSIGLEKYGHLIEVGNNSNGNIVIVIVGTLGNALTYLTQTDGSNDNWTKEIDMKAYATQMRLKNNSSGKLELVYITPVTGEIFSTQEQSESL